MAMHYFLSGDVVHAFDEDDDPSWYEGMQRITEEHAMQLAVRPPDNLPVTSCTPAQGLVALFALKGITEEDVLNAIASIPDEVQRYTAKIGYQRTTTWERASPTMQAMTQLLQLSDADLDELFAYAVNVQV